MKEFVYSKEELQMIERFSKTFVITSTSQILEFGKIVQSRLSTLSSSILLESKNKDVDSITSIVNSIVNELNKMNKKKESRGFFSIFSKQQEENNDIQYESILSNVELLKEELEKQLIVLYKDLQLLELMSANNYEYLRELNMYLIAGKTILENNKNEAIKYKDDPNKYNDLLQAIDRFEKRLYDLELTKTMTIQMHPQINLMKNNTYSLIDRINTIIHTTIPLVRSQLVILLSQQNNKKVIEEQQEISKLLNETLTNNANGLSFMSKELSSQLERGIVSELTLQKTTEELLNAINDLTKEENKEEIKEDNNQSNRPPQLGLTITH